MSKEVHFVLDPNSELTAEEIAMIEAARDLPPVYDPDNPPIDPIETPKQYAALLQAVAERNRRVAAVVVVRLSASFCRKRQNSIRRRLLLFASQTLRWFAPRFFFMSASQ